MLKVFGDGREEREPTVNYPEKALSRPARGWNVDANLEPAFATLVGIVLLDGQGDILGEQTCETAQEAVPEVPRVPRVSAERAVGLAGFDGLTVGAVSKSRKVAVPPVTPVPPHTDNYIR